MPGKTVFLAGFATGYVLGAKAGRQRYEQIVTTARSIMGRPEVERLTETAKQEAGELMGTAKRVVTDKLGGEDVTDQVTAAPEPGVRL